jgi:hypothetical protein
MKNDLLMKLHSFAQQRYVTLDMLHNSEQKADAAFHRPAIAQNPLLAVVIRR